MELTGYSKEMRLSIILRACLRECFDHEKRHSSIYCPRNSVIGTDKFAVVVLIAVVAHHTGQHVGCLRHVGGVDGSRRILRNSGKFRGQYVIDRLLEKYAFIDHMAVLLARTLRP